MAADISLRLDPGDWLGVLGPNGAGKSSLLAALAGLLPHDGTISITGTPTNMLSRRERARLVGYLPQNPVFPEQLNVADYVLLGRVPHAGYFGRHSEKDRQIAERILRRLDLVALQARPLGTISGGERQRAQLARALAVQAPILLADEPTTALDLGHQQRALELIDELRATDGLTIVTAMHDLSLAAQYPNRLLLLHGGASVAQGSPTDVLTAERLATCYGIHAKVETDDSGQPTVWVQRPGR
ncbi:MAG: ABC transporter ATP-binding protein [Steroidobacteraceae bacterium]